MATDVAARGIDLPKLELVIHADLPTNAEGLLHRSGRTGRAGRKGISALIVPPKAVKKAERLLKFAKITAEWTTPPDADDILRRDEERLLDDPAWSEDISEAQAGFAAKLLAKFSPEQIAAGYLRLYHAGHSAPEELMAPDARPERKARTPFGPSAWVALTVGREERAEARWLLPLLLRAGNLEKDAIGAIRVQQSETYVEMKAPQRDGFLASLGEGGVLEDGIVARPMDGPPADTRAPRGPAPRNPAPRRPEAEKPRDDVIRQDRAPDVGGEANADVPGPAPRKPRHSGDAATGKPRDDRPAGKPHAKPGGAFGAKPGGSSWKGKGEGKPRGKPDGKAYEKRDGKPGAKAYGKQDGALGGKPSVKRDGKPGDKPFGKRDGKPGEKPFGKRDGKPGDKPFAKRDGKPGGKPYAKQEGKPAASKVNAADPSKRLARPGKPSGPKGGSKGGKGKPGPGGGEPPRRRT